MWHEAGLIYFRNSIKAIHRNSFSTCYYLDWDHKVGRAKQIPTTSWHYRSFQLFGIIFILFVEPVLLFQSYQFSKSDLHEKNDMKSACLTYIATILFWGSIPYVCLLMRKSGPPRFIKCYESVLTLDKQLQGTVLIYLI